MDLSRLKNILVDTSTTKYLDVLRWDTPSENDGVGQVDHLDRLEARKKRYPFAYAFSLRPV